MSEKLPERVGLFGGTFDPPHVGHLILASEAKSQYEYIEKHHLCQQSEIINRHS